MMPLSEIFFLAIVLYLLYRFVFNLLLPVVRTTRHVRQQFRNMQEPPEDIRAEPPPRRQRPAKNPPADEYIDFEEIK